MDQAGYEWIRQDIWEHGDRYQSQSRQHVSYHNRGAIAYLIYESCRQEINKKLHQEIQGDQHGYIRERNSEILMERKEKERNEIDRNGLNDIGRETCTHCAFITQLHRIENLLASQKQ